VTVASEVGLDAVEAKAVLDGDAYASAVRSDEEEAADLGVSGVPFFAVGRRYGVSGAQPAEVLLEVLERAWQDAGHAADVADAAAVADVADAVTSGGSACDGEACPA